MNKIKINDTTIKDIFQGVSLTDINISRYKKIFELLDSCGFESVEVWGSSSFEELLNNNFSKNPWSYLKELKELLVKTPLQITIGAKNLAGFDYFSDEIIKRFIKISVSSGISRFRVFDALNNIENMAYTINEIISEGAKCEGVIIFENTRSINFYINFIHRLSDMGCESVCIKDTESLLTPSAIRKFFIKMASESRVPLFFSSKDLKSLQVSNYLEAIKSGFKGVDLSLTPSDFCQTSYPTAFAFLFSLNGFDFGAELNINKINTAFKLVSEKIYPNLKKYNQAPGFILSQENNSVPPKWLLSALYRQLQEIGETDRLEEVVLEMQNIKQKSGSPTFSAPVGHIIAGQAILNTIFSSEKWEMISDEMIFLLDGFYGKPSGEIDEELRKKLNLPDRKKKVFMNCINYEICKKEISNLTDKEEDILSYCLFSDKTLQLLGKNLKKMGGNKEISEFSKNIKSGEKKMSTFSENDIEKIKQIIALLEHSSLEEITLEKDDIKIKLSKPSKINTFSKTTRESFEVLPNSLNKQKAIISDSETFNNIETAEILPVNKDISKETINENNKDNSIVEIKSPIVGTFYCAPGPQEKPFVQKGQKIKKGDVLCIVEAMKLMNKITAELDGIVEEILVNNEDPVEFGKTLMKVKAL